MCQSGSRLSPLGQTTIKRCLDLSRDASLPNMDVLGPSSAKEAHTSIMHTVLHYWRSIQYITVSPHRTILRQMGKSRYETRKSRIYWRKLFDQMGKIGRTSFLMLYGRIEWPTRHPSRCLFFGLSSRKHATFQLSLMITCKLDMIIHDY